MIVTICSVSYNPLNQQLAKMLIIVHPPALSHGDNFDLEVNI
jgi:hypothetical protein